MALRVVGFYPSESLTRQYWGICKKIKVGMTLEEARQVVGDLKYQYWTQDSKSAVILIQKSDNGVEYALEYDMVFAGSDNMGIHFDQNTLLVTKIFCGER